MCVSDKTSVEPKKPCPHCQKKITMSNLKQSAHAAEPVPRFHSRSDRSVSGAMTRSKALTCNTLSASHRSSVFLGLLYRIIMLAGGLVKRVNTAVVTFHAFLESSSRALEIVLLLHHKTIKNKSGLRLSQEYGQLEKNVDSGLLKDMLGYVEHNVPYGKRFVSPLVRQKISPLLKEQLVPGV
ncbi:hypothetical protein J6590_094305 [Homalodisca vitripennis]|nr:hypothetical protein J6590_094305 [Homalodisca vitripennis]